MAYLYSMILKIECIHLFYWMNLMCQKMLMMMCVLGFYSSETLKIILYFIWLHIWIIRSQCITQHSAYSLFNFYWKIFYGELQVNTFNVHFQLKIQTLSKTKYWYFITIASIDVDWNISIQLNIFGLTIKYVKLNQNIKKNTIYQLRVSWTLIQKPNTLLLNVTSRTKPHILDYIHVWIKRNKPQLYPHLWMCTLMNDNKTKIHAMQL